MAFGYTGRDAIYLKVDQPVRTYLEKVLEFDPVNNFHLHGGMFDYIPSGTSDKPTMYNHIASLTKGDRGIMKLAYHFPAEFMFNAHKTSLFALDGRVSSI
jgi:hypothetical protein